jgi:O-succinylbenzoate synthase
MKIESITLHHISMPLVAPFETSFGREVDRQCVIIALRSEGLTGYGECVATRDPGYNYETTGTAMHILKEFVAPLLLGQDVIDADDFQKRVEGIRGHHLAKAGVEMALWDLLGKRDGNRSERCSAAGAIESTWGYRSGSRNRSWRWSGP